MDKLLQGVLEPIIQTGSLTLTTASGHRFSVGDGTGTPVSVRIATPQAQRQILLDPDLKLGEAYTDGSLQIEEGTLTDLLALILSQDHHSKRPKWTWLLLASRYLQRRLQQFNRRGRSRKNVAHHYDLDARLYDLFLDDDRQYSCGYFETRDQSLDEAQLAKKRHIAAKLLARPGTGILDIGSGWGGLALYLSETCGAQTTGITLSEEQLALSRLRASQRDFAPHANFLFQDYRDVTGQFERIVSVGMFEHVGVGHYDAFFRKCSKLLTDDGVMLLHSIGRSDRPGITNPWIAKYIFPGGYIPSLSEVLPAIERAGLLVTDIEILRLHYAETLKAWRERFVARRDEVIRIYDERFARLWEFYLVASEMAFRQQAMMVFQIQIAKRQDVVPITRDYIALEESRLRELERRPGWHRRMAIAAE